MSKVYQLTEGKRVYAIGDIHGFADELAVMHDLIAEDVAANPIDEAIIVYVGDYIDRGPDSKGVIDMVIERELVAPEFQHVYLLGNHEDAMFHEFLKDPQGHRQDWLQWGGAEAAVSYGVEIDHSKAYAPEAERIAKELSDAMPESHKEFLNNLSLYHVIDDYLFVHAGIRPGVPLEKQSKQDLTFTREPFMSHEGHHPYRVVHGHTPPRDLKIDIRPNRINVDTGLYMGGPLTCAVIEGSDIRVLQVLNQP